MRTVLALMLIGIVVLIVQSQLTKTQLEHVLSDAIKETLNTMATKLTTTFTCTTGGMTMEHTVTTTQANGESPEDFAARHKAAVLAAKAELCD